VEWADSSVHLGLTRETVKNSPGFDPSKAVNRKNRPLTPC
jgi:hypothetical protein